MPPRRRVSAPVDRVYESGPTLHQKRFKSPPKSKNRRTYGKTSTISVPRTPKLKDDNTLTQMDWVKLLEVQHDESVEAEVDTNDSSDYDKAAETRRKKRRRTAGDESSTIPSYHTQTLTQAYPSFSSTNEEGNNQHNLEDVSDIHHRPSYLRQSGTFKGITGQKPLVAGKENILPRIHSSSSRPMRKSRTKSSNLEFAQEQERPEDEADIYDVYEPPSSSRQAAPSKRSSKRKSVMAKKSPSPTNLPGSKVERHGVAAYGITKEAPALTNTMPPPQTPRKPLVQEIPSSRSPATPLSTHSLRSQSQTPLQERRINPPNFSSIYHNSLSTPERSSISAGSNLPDIPLFPNVRRINQVSPEKYPKLEIDDTFSSATNVSQMTRIPSSPTKPRSSPAKSVRFAVPDQDVGAEAPESSLNAKHAIPSVPSKSLGSQQPLLEIQDSEAESEDDYEDETNHEAMQEQEPRNDITNHETFADKPDKISGEEYDAVSESNYGDIGEETQFQAFKEVERLTSSSLSEPPPEIEVMERDSVNEETPTKDTQYAAPETVVEKTQFLETQRILPHEVDAMAPRTANSDVFVSMTPQNITNIISRSKTYEMRNWSFPPEVVRLWIYETKPVCAVKYMCSIGPAMRPDQLLDDVGLGNKEFNLKSERGSWHAYEILAVYELLDPVDRAALLEKEWIKQEPRKWTRIGPAVADDLVSNLKPALFSVTEETEAPPEVMPETPPSSNTDTQEAEAQLLSTIQQYTQPVIVADSEPTKSIKPEPESHYGAAVRNLGTQQFLKPQPKFHHSLPLTTSSSEDTQKPSDDPKLPPTLSQATTVDLSQTQTPRRHRHSLIEIDEDVILESPSRPLPSSTPVRIDSTPTQLPKLRRQETSRSDKLDRQAPESLLPFSMASSQLLTKSQLLSESLLQDSVPGPPPFVSDSEDEDDDDGDDEL